MIKSRVQELESFGCEVVVQAIPDLAQGGGTSYCLNIVTLFQSET
jgi:hypothetical protein